MDSTQNFRKYYKLHYISYPMQKKSYTRKAHLEWRKKLIERDKGCIVCGETHSMNAHHLVPDCVKYREFQFDPSNGVMLCPTHHLWGIMSAHKNPFWFRMWMKKHRLGTLQLAEDRIEDLG